MGNNVPISRMGRAIAKYSNSRAGYTSKYLSVSDKIVRILRAAVQIITSFFDDSLDPRNIRLHIWRAGFVPVSPGRVTGLREPSHLMWEQDLVFIACSTQTALITRVVSCTRSA